MKIIYYTSGITGIGRLLFGIAIGNALVRNRIECDYTILHTSHMGHLADDFHNIKVPIENEIELSEKYYHKSVLYKTLTKLKPDILLVNHQWFMLHNFMHALHCKKIYLSDMTVDDHFKVTLTDGEMTFNESQYDRIIAIEPFNSRIPMETINPMIIRNREEIYSKEKALRLLDMTGEKKTALYSILPDESGDDPYWEKYSYIEEEYEVIRLTLNNMIFPIVDYYNAFDLIISGGGYNNVWSAVYFKKNALYEPVKKKFHDETLRVDVSRIFTFDINGADQLVNLMMNM